jgi:hypothetical protein
MSGCVRSAGQWHGLIGKSEKWTVAVGGFVSAFCTLRFPSLAIPRKLEDRIQIITSTPVFFGPYMEQERLVEIFRKESAKAFGAESRGVWIETAKKGYRSVLAHALKYTAKLPATTPEGLAAYEKVLVGVRRYAVRGFLQGVCFEEEKRNKPKCPECRESLQRISGLGIVPLSDVADIPFLAEEKSQYEDTRKDDEFCFLQSEEMASHAPRAPC